MKVLLIDNGTTLLDELHRLIPGREITRRWSEDYGDTSSFDLIVLSGGSLYSVESRKFARESELLQNSDVPVIGICLGHQIIADTFGGTLDLMADREKGYATIRVTTQHEIFADHKSFYVWESHTYAVTDPGAELESLAESDHAIAVLKHSSRPIIGFQFHPEHHRDKQFGDEVFMNTLKHLGVVK